MRKLIYCSNSKTHRHEQLSMYPCPPNEREREMWTPDLSIFSPKVKCIRHGITYAQASWHIVDSKQLTRWPLNNFGHYWLTVWCSFKDIYSYIYKQLLKILRTAIRNMSYNYEIVLLKQKRLNVKHKNIYRKVKKSFYTGSIHFYLCPAI